MKYYCKNCGSTLTLADNRLVGESFYPCPVCTEWDDAERFVYMRPVPDRETVEQREKRTGKPVDYDTAVWWIFADDGDTWCLNTYKWVLTEVRDPVIIVIADSPTQPPDGWRPE
jgi:hypothetical protein